MTGDQGKEQRTGLASLLLVLLPLALLILGIILVASPWFRAVDSAHDTLNTRVPAAGSQRLPGPGGRALPEKPDELDVRPRTSWLALDPNARLTRIGLGSCLSQRHPQPIWKAVLDAKPQVFLMMGDNVYADIKTPDGRDLADGYRMQLAHQDFSQARLVLPFLATWDDHDYGSNDGGADFAGKPVAERLFREYWQMPAAAGHTGGIHYARTYGPDGQRVQIIMLDTRYFRSPLKLKGPDFPHWGKYEPDLNASKTMLGPTQWAWLEQTLRQPAEIRLIVSSIQVLSDGHGFERWGNLPAERDLLMRMIESTGANGVVLLSGDRHSGALYSRTLGQRRILPELTSSSLNRPYGPSKDAKMPELISEPYAAENFGLVDIDWDKRSVHLSLRGFYAEEVDGLSLSFADLGITN